MQPGFLQGADDQPQYYRFVPGIYSDYSKRSHEQLVEDVKVLHDFTKRLVREKDELWICLQEVRKELRRERRWRNALLTALGFTMVTIGGILKFLIPYAIKGMILAK
jgi:hypothetical protein